MTCLTPRSTPSSLPLMTLSNKAVCDRSMAQCSASCVLRQQGVAPQKNDSRRPSLQRKPLVCHGARLVRSSESRVRVRDSATSASSTGDRLDSGPQPPKQLPTGGNRWRDDRAARFRRQSCREPSMSAARLTEVMNLGIRSCREEDWVTVQQNNICFSTWGFLVVALTAGAALVGCDSSSSEPPGSTANSRAVPDVDAVAAWCQPALAEFDSRVPLQPTSLVDGLESVPTTDMSTAIVEKSTAPWRRAASNSKWAAIPTEATNGRPRRSSTRSTRFAVRTWSPLKSRHRRRRRPSASSTLVRRAVSQATVPLLRHRANRDPSRTLQHAE